MSDTGGADSSATLGDAIRVSVFFALLTGALEAAKKSVRILVLHEIIGVSRDYPWMTPLAYLCFFVPLALLLVAAARMSRRAVSLQMFVAVFAFLGAFALLLPYTELALVAEMILAAGIAVLVYRWVASHPGRSRVVVNRGSIVLAALVALIGGGAALWRPVAEARASASVPVPATSKPNVLLIIFDTVRRSNLSLYGYDRPTTAEMDRWARSATVFDHAIAPAPWTLPTHASLFTGRRPGALGVDWEKPLPADGPKTLAEALRAAGYQTAGFVSNHYYTSYESGLNRGFNHYDDYRITARLILANAAYGRSGFFTDVIDDPSPRGVVNALLHFSLRRVIRPSHIHRMAPEITDSFLAWQQVDRSRPFFAFLNYMAAHRPYRAYEPWKSKFASTPPKPTDRYDAAIARLDHEVGRLLDSLRTRGVLENTLVVVSSDHGEHFGEHGLEEHGNSLYRPLIEVPLLMLYPARVPAGGRISAMVSLQDVAATILDVTDNEDREGFPGSSLAKYWSASPPSQPASVLSELSKGINVPSSQRNSAGGLESLISPQFHYIRSETGAEELYDYGRDSAEAHNLVDIPSMQGELARLRLDLAAALRRP